MTNSSISKDDIRAAFARGDLKAQATRLDQKTGHLVDLDAPQPGGLVHIVSRAAGGEVAGYHVQPDGSLVRRHEPNRVWGSEMDDVVSEVLERPARS